MERGAMTALAALARAPMARTRAPAPMARAAMRNLMPGARLAVAAPARVAAALILALALAVLGLRAVLRLRVLVAARRATVARARGEARAAAMVGAEEARTISHVISLTALPHLEQRRSLRCRTSRTTTLLARTVAAVEVAKVAGATRAEGRARRAELQIRIRTRRLCRLSGRMPSRPLLERLLNQEVIHGHHQWSSSMIITPSSRMTSRMMTY